MKTSLLTLAILSMVSDAFAQSTSAALSTKPATVETMNADVSATMSTAALTTAALTTLLLPAVGALPLQPAPAKQTIAATPEVPGPSPVLPTAKVQVRKLPPPMPPGLPRRNAGNKQARLMRWSVPVARSNIPMGIHVRRSPAHPCTSARSRCRTARR
jgi:hypothetical protein